MVGGIWARWRRLWEGGGGRERLAGWVLPPLVLGLTLAAGLTPLGRQVEDLTLDWRFRARGGGDPPAHPDLVIVGIEEEGLEQWGRWPWSREVHAQLLTLLGQRPPRVVGFDLLFTEPSREEEEDRKFGDALVHHPGAITGADAQEALEGRGSFEEEYIGNTGALLRVEGDPGRLVGHDTALFPVPFLAESSSTGFVNAPPDVRGMRRRVPLLVRCGTRVFPSLVTQVLMQYAGAGPEEVTGRLGDRLILQGKNGTLEIPMDDRGRLLINYRHPDGFTGFSYFRLFWQLYQVQEGEAWPEGFPPVRDQVLLIGQTASGLTDMGPTPHQPGSPLVMVHANAINNVLQGDYLRELPWGWVVLGWLAVAWGTVMSLRKEAVWLAVLVPGAVMSGYSWLAFALFAGSSLQLPLFWPVTGFVLVHGLAVVERLIGERQAKARIKSMFGTYVAPEVVEKMIASGEEPKLGGEEVEITAFFSDIEGFSTFSEQLEPRRLVALMNEYLTEMNEILQDHGGTLDKFIGDAIVGMFGAPLWFEGHAYQACRSSVLMQERQAWLREKWRSEAQWPEAVVGMRTRIGLNSGLAVIGNMGSRRRFNYTMMGDTVNLAARTESAAKTYGVFTMVTGETRRLARAHRDDLVFRYLDKVIVKGRSHPVEMYEVVGLQAEVGKEWEACLESYQKGMEDYLRREWDAAERAFLRSAEKEPGRGGGAAGEGTNPSLVMLERCRTLRAEPPGEDWDGVYRLQSK